MSVDVESTSSQIISITPLLRRLWPSPSDHNVTAAEISHAVSHVLSNRISPVQVGALLTCLHFTGWERRPDVLAECAKSMRQVATNVDCNSITTVIKQKDRAEGAYNGGLVGFEVQLKTNQLMHLSVILLAREVIPIILLTFLQLLPFWLQLFCLLVSMETVPPPPGLGQPICSTLLCPFHQI